MSNTNEEVDDVRAVYEYDLPEEVQALGDKYVKKTIGLQKLRMREELAALDKAGQSAAKAGYFMVLAALVEVDGRRLDKANGEDERILNRCDPAIRALIVEAQADVGSVPKGASDAFLKTRRVKVG